MMELFRTLLAQLAEFKREKAQVTDALNAEYLAARLEAGREYLASKGPRFAKKAAGLTLETLSKHVGFDVLGAVLDRYTPQVDVLEAGWKECRETLRAQLCAAAETAERSPVAERTQWLHVEWYYHGGYSTQGYAAAKYLREAANTHVLQLQAWGFEARIVEGEAGLDVQALVRDMDDVALFAYLPGMPLREWVKSCWKRGVNPRVYNPFLPHGLEDRYGLDYFGGEKKVNV